MSDGIDLKYETPGFIILLLTAGVSFVFCDDFHQYLEELFQPDSYSWYLSILIKTSLLMSYVIPMGVGGLLVQTKNGVIQLSGMLCVGIAMGAVLRIALIVTGIMNPYQF